MATSDPSGEPTQVNWFWRALRWLVHTLFIRVLGWRHTVQGLDHVPEDGPAVVTWNHHSYVDFFMLGLAIFDGRGRVVRALGKSEVWDNPVTRWFAIRATAVPVYRGARGGGGALDAALAALRQGDLVVLAPEQTISQSFELLPFAPGAAIMAFKTGAPVVPSAGWGSHRFTTKGHTVVRSNARRLAVTVSFGEPLRYGEGETVDEFNDRLRAATQQLLHELQEAYPDQPRDAEDRWWVPARLGGDAPSHEQVMAEHLERMQARRDQAATRPPGDQ